MSLREETPYLVENIKREKRNIIPSMCGRWKNHSRKLDANQFAWRTEGLTTDTTIYSARKMEGENVIKD